MEGGTVQVFLPEMPQDVTAALTHSRSRWMEGKQKSGRAPAALLSWCNTFHWNLFRQTARLGHAATAWQTAEGKSHAHSTQVPWSTIYMLHLLNVLWTAMMKLLPHSLCYCGRRSGAPAESQRPSLCGLWAAVVPQCFLFGRRPLIVACGKLHSGILWQYHTETQRQKSIKYRCRKKNRKCTIYQNKAGNECNWNMWKTEKRKNTQHEMWQWWQSLRLTARERTLSFNFNWNQV